MSTHTAPDGQRPLVGQSLRRVEDRRLLRGLGRYVPDHDLPGTLHAAFLRSTHAHARLRAVNVDAARAVSGVVTVFTAADLGQPTYGRVQAFHPRLEAQLHPRIQQAPRPLLAFDKVRYAGEAIAVVIAESRYAAEDALDLIEVDYEPLPAVVDAEAALRPDSAKVFDHWDDNCQVEFRVGTGDADAALKGADVVIRSRTRTHRHVCCPMETRGVLASFDAGRGTLTVWDSTQNPHWIRDALARVTGLPLRQIRVIAPDVGGGFGVKIQAYSDELLIPLLAMRLRRPVKWIEDRREHFLATAHAREQVHEVELGARRDGTLVALRDNAVIDNGAYLDSTVHAYNAVVGSVGPYRIPNVSLHYRLVSTNKMNQAVYRGAGAPEANFALDRALQVLAGELKMDPLALKRKNLVRPDDMPHKVGMPFRDGVMIEYHTGNFPAVFDKGLELINYAGFAARQQRARAEGRYRGIGLSFFVKGTGSPPHEAARVAIEQGGKVVVYLGSTSQGQGHETSMAQICADALGVPFEDISLVQGDTAPLDYGEGARASRSTILGGSAIHIAATRVREKALAAASQLLEVAVDDLELREGKVFAKGAPDRSVTLAAVARAVAVDRVLGDDVEPALVASEIFKARSITFVNGVHLAEVEVDPETGHVDVQKYVLVEDCGHLVNPLLVEGQAHGAVAQALGGALYEEIRYDASGQPVTTTFMDYLMPTACEIPTITTGHFDTPPWPPNPLGVKGAGEGGTVGTSAALATAIENALADFNVRITETPFSPDNIRKAIVRARTATP